jgi:hypothetical protein
MSGDDDGGYRDPCDLKTGWSCAFPGSLGLLTKREAELFLSDDKAFEAAIAELAGLDDPPEGTADPK